MYFKVIDDNGNEWFLYGNHNLNPAEFFKTTGGDITGRTRIKNKLFVSQLAGFQDAEPSILLAIGDNDTGFHSTADGVTSYYSNGRLIYNMTQLWGSHNFDPNTKLNTNGGTINGNLTVTGALHSNNDISAFSDERLKQDICNLSKSESDKENLVNKLKTIDIHSYKLLGKDTIEFGVIAQELLKIFPEMVTSSDGEIVMDKTGQPINPHRVMYMHFIPLLLLYCQELNSKVDMLTKQINGE